MTDILLGLAMTAAGLLLCGRGGLRIRRSFPAWSALAAAFLGAGLGHIHAHHRLFHGPASLWLAIGLGIAIGAASLRWYEVAVMVSLTAIGIAISVALLVLAHAQWNWIEVGIGAVIGAVLGFFSIISSLHRFVLLWLTAFAGATGVITGLMLLNGFVTTDELAVAHTTQRVGATPGWWIAGLGLAALGVGAQMLKGERHRVTTRDRWVDAGGGQLRAT